jgi:hypothetical protein
MIEALIAILFLAGASSQSSKKKEEHREQLMQRLFPPQYKLSPDTGPQWARFLAQYKEDPSITKEQLVAWDKAQEAGEKPPILGYLMTYDIVTPESAEDGDVAERGWAESGGWRYPEDYSTKPSEYPPVSRIKASDWWGENKDHAAAREMADSLIYDYAENDEYADGRTYRVDGDDLMAETDDGDAGTETLYFHLEGWSPHQLKIIRILVKARDADMDLTDALQ